MGFRNTLGLDFTAPVQPTTQTGSENENEQGSDYSDIMKQIIDTGSVTVEKNGHLIHCLTVIGQIEGHYILPSQNKTTKYEHMIPQLVAIEESASIDGLLIILNTVGGDIEAGLALAEGDDYDSAVIGDMAAQISGKLLQMANGAVYDENREVFRIHDAKLDALEEIADTCAGQPILVFYNYQHDLERLQERFPRAVKMGGSDTITAWNNGEIPMLLCQPASAGHGLNLQEGGHISVWFGLTWSLELYQQANDRLHRMGQRNAVMVHHLVAEDTLDERVMAAITRKDATQKGLLDALKSYIKEELT